MRHPLQKKSRIVLIIGIISLLLLALTPVLVLAKSDGPADALRKAWQRAASLGSYTFDSGVVQSVHPTARLENVGRQTTTRTLHVQGAMDPLAEAMSLHIAGDTGNGRQVADLKIENGQVFGRLSADDPWTAVEQSPADLFAPGGDPLGFLAAAGNVHELQAGESALFPDSLLPDAVAGSVTRYAFDLDGEAFAEFMREQVDDYLRRHENMPGSMVVVLPQSYAGMSGQGEIWIGADGLPLRQMIHMELPPAKNAIDWVEADITTTFANWDTSTGNALALLARDPTRLLAEPAALAAILGPSTRENIALGIFGGSLLLLLCGFVALTIVKRRSPRYYAALAVVIVAATVLSPLAQVSEANQAAEFNRRQEAKADDAAAEQDQAVAQAGLEQELSGRDFDPHSAPQRVTQQQTTESLPAAGGPTLDQRAAKVMALDVCDYTTGADCDGDGLTNDSEILRLGTDPGLADSDGDGISDNAEVAGFDVAGVTWYTNPLNADSNGDGLIDSMECPQRADINDDGTVNSGFVLSACRDGDGDGEPDVWDYDNDGDKVPDSVDISPDYTGAMSTQLHDDLTLDLSGFTTGKALFVDLAIRPQEDRFLYLTDNVVDWPAADVDGQITRVYTDTLADIGISHPDGKASNGDMMLKNLLEITIPYDSSNPTGSLPKLSSYTGAITTQTPLEDWLDEDALAQYGISVTQEEDGTRVAYVALNVVQDKTGNTPVAWSAHMLYRPEVATWGTDHSARMLWMVYGVSDSCTIPDTVDPESDEYETWCDVNNLDHWTAGSELELLHTYQEPVYLTGLAVREDHGTDAAIIAQNNALSAPYEDYLWHLAGGLQEAYLDGQVDGSNNRLDVAAIGTRFNDGSATPDGAPQRWGIPKSALSVSSHTGYSEQAAGLVDVVNNQTPALLNSTYPSAPDDSVVTLLFARDDHYISTAMGDAGPGTVTVNDATGEISVGLGGTHVTTYSTLNWAPFTKTADGWIAADVYPYLDSLVTRLDSVISDADLTTLSGGTVPDDLDLARRGAISVAQNYYLASFMGRSNVTAVDSTPVDDTVMDDSDLALAAGDKPVVVLNQVILDSYQLFFLKSSVTTLDGEAVSSTVFEVPSTATVLQNLGEMALNWNTPVSALNSVKTPLKYFLKEYYKQQGLILKTNISIGKIAKNASRYVAALSIAIQAFTIIYDVYPDSMVVQLVTDSLVVLSETMSAFSAFTAIWHYYNAVSLAQSAVLKGIQLNLTISASVTLAIGVAVAVGAFLYVVFTNDLSPGSIAYNMAVAALVAQIIVAILLAILAFSVVGTAFVAVLGLIDAILYLICRVENRGDNSVFCTGITGQVARALAEAFYQVDPIVKLGKKDRLQFAFDNLELVDKQLGFSVNNQLALSVTVTNTISLDDKLFFSGTNDSPGNSQYRNDAAQKLNNSTFAYFLQQSPVNQHAGLDFNQVNWTRLNSEKYQAVFTAGNTFDLSTAGVGIDRGLPLYMTEALLVKYMECTYAVVTYTCDFGKEFRTSVHLDWTGNLRFDLFPATFGQFYSLVSAGLTGGNAYRFSWDSRFPALQDADGDGLRNQAFEGADPNDLTADSDGDGLYDFWEVKNGTDPLRVDDDCDGLSDYWEVFHQLDPWSPDSDGDGLLDGEELFHPPSYGSVCDTTPSSLWEGGWTVVYDYAGDTPLITLVSADPAEPDSDGDTITDKLEKVYGYNPNVHSVLNVMSLDANAPNPYVIPGGTLAYTATVKNELDNRIAYGLLEAELPTDNVQNTQVIDTLMPQASADFLGDVTAPSVSQTQVMSLTIRAGAVLDDPATGRVLWLHMNETNGSTTFVDDSLTVGGPHNATCASSGDCPSVVQVNGTDGGALDFDGSDVITVPDHDDFDLDQFTISLWVQRDTTSGAQSFIAKGATGFSIGTSGNPVNARIYLDDCTTPVTVSGSLTPETASYHVVLTYGNGLLTLYVNGVQTGSAAAASLCSNDDDIQIGNGLNGVLDELQIFSRALSAEEVANLARIPVFFLPNFKSTPSPAYDDYDASQYQASEITCGQTNSEFPCPTVAAGKAGNGFAFNESNYLLTSSKVLDLGRNSSSFSMAFWLYPQTGYTPDDDHYNQQAQMIIGFHGFLFSDYTWAGPSLYIRKNGRVIVRFGYRNHGGYCEAASTTGVVSTNQWQHLSLVFDGANFRVYKNGVLSDTFSDPSCSGQTPSGLGIFHIGHGVNPAVKFDDITCNGCDNGEAFIWSDLTALNNGYGRRELVWLAAHNQLDNHELNTIDQWATGPGGFLDFQVCNWDSDPNTPNGCDNPPNGEDQALFFGAAPSTKIEETIAYDHALGSVYQYLVLPTRYNVDLNYTVYSTGLKGRLDEINLFNVALTGDEVLGVYNGSLRGLELKLDEPPGQHLFEDTSGNNFSASCSGTTCPDSGIPGRANQSLRFDGVDDQVTTEAADTLGLTDSSFTVMAWVKLDSLSGDQSILGTDTLAAREGLHLVVRNGVPYMGFYGTGNDTSGATTLETGKWYHLAFRYNKDTQQQAIFINGVQDVAATGRASFLGTDTVHIGRARGGHYFDGLIDHVVNQRSALSLADIRAVMNQAPVLNLHLDEDLATTTFVDDTPLANHATCAASSCPAAGAKGQMREAAVFDGGDRKLTVAANAAYNLSQFTVGLWVKPNNRRTQIQPLVSKRDMANGGGNVNYALLLHPDNTVRFLMQESNCTSYRQLNTTTAMLDGQWNHVMATYDGQTMRLYINGSPDPITETQTNGACLASQDITVGGGSYVDAWSDFDGQMDEITVHGAALSPAEVRDIYDYQVSWYDLTYSLPVVIDNDPPTISMQLDRNFVSAGSGKIWLVSASDVGSYVELAAANLLQGSTNEVVLLQREGDSWIFLVPELLPGVTYTLQLVARDAANNFGQSPDYDFTVDGQAPTATVNAAQQAGVLPVTDSLNLGGQVSDDLSGAAPGSVSVALLDDNGQSASGFQQATLTNLRSSNDWSVDYPFDPSPYGTYDVVVRASDNVGNQSEATAGTVRLDGIAPSGDVSLPTPQIKPNATVVTGTATDVPYPLADRYLTLHFEDASGATGFVDSSGRFYNAKCSTCPAAGQPGRYGLAADFDGVDDELEISASEPVSTTAELGLYDSSFTVMAWVNVDAITGNVQPIFGSAANGDLQSLTLGLLEDGRPAMRFGGAGNAIEGPVPLPVSQWAHLAFRYNKEGQEQAIFVNGVAVNISSGRLPFVGESQVFVGRGADPGHFDGRIDELFVVGRALTADEIYDIANPLDTGVTQVLLRLRHQDDGDQGPDEGVWIDVTPAVHAADVDTWTYTPPDGTRLGPTRIDLKVTDSSGLQRYQPNTWNGEVTDSPLAVTLASFEATSQPGAVLLTWETVSELDNLGFNLYRAEAEGGPWMQLNQALIASPNPGGAVGSSYQWIDESVTPGARYWYRLEAIDLAGQSETVSEISIVAGETMLTQRVFLPVILK